MYALTPSGETSVLNICRRTGQVFSEAGQFEHFLRQLLRGVCVQVDGMV